MVSMSITLAKPLSVRGASHQPPLMGSCLTISDTCLHCPPRTQASLRILCSLMIGLMFNGGSVDIFLHGEYGFSPVMSCCYSREWMWN